MYPITNLFLSLFNTGNVQVDAYKILRHKKIAHGINFGAYFLFALFVYYVFEHPVLTLQNFPFGNFITYLFSAFFNRQLSFDIPLNIRRGLTWDYVSKDNPPKSITDRIEIAIFGKNGKLPVYCYAVCLLICTILNYTLCAK